MAHLLVFGFIHAVMLCSFCAHSLSNPSNLTNTTLEVKYVTPKQNRTCRTSDELPCLTLEDYAAKVTDKPFVNNTTFLFRPGNHLLSIKVNLTDIHNISFLALSDKAANIIVINRSAGFVWHRCKNVQISNIIFKVRHSFSYILTFEHTDSVKLSSIKSTAAQTQRYLSSNFLIWS